jgi:hypothetical protein
MEMKKENNSMEYIEFANWYYNKLSEMAKDNIKLANSDLRDLYRDPRIKHPFKSIKSIENTYKDTSYKIRTNYHWLDGEIHKYYIAISRLWENTLSFAEWIMEVKEFIQFIRYSEKCFMFRNESSIDRENREYAVYVENEENTLYIRDFTDDIKIKISFTESLVNDIVIDTTSNSLADYVESGKTPKKQITVEFIDITIVREYGKQLANQFRFMSSENPKYNDESDKILMDITRSLISKYLKLTLYDIFDNYIRKFAGFEDDRMKLEHAINGTLLFGYKE